MSISIFGASDANLRLAQQYIQLQRFKEALDILESDWAKFKNQHTGLYLARTWHALKESQKALNFLKELDLDLNIINLNMALINYDLYNFKDAIQSIEKMNENNYHKAPFLNWVKKLTPHQIPSAESYQDATKLRFTSLDIQSRVILTLEEFMPTEVMKRAGEESLPPQFNPLLFKSKRIELKKIKHTELSIKANKALAENNTDLAIHLQSEMLNLQFNAKESTQLLNKIALIKLEQEENSLSGEEKYFYLFINGQYSNLINDFVQRSQADISNNMIEMAGLAYFSIKDYQQSIQVLNRVNFYDLTEMALLYKALAHYRHGEQSCAIELLKPYFIKEPSAFTNTIYTFFKTIYPDSEFSFQFD